MHRRHNTTGWVGLVVTAVLAPLVVWSAVGSARAAGDKLALQCDRNVYEFGEVESDAVIEHAFTLINRGEKEAAGLQAMPDCGCITAELSEEKAAAGGRVIAHVRMDVQSYHGPVQRKVYVTAGEGRAVTLVLRGVVK